MTGKPANASSAAATEGALAILANDYLVAEDVCLPSDLTTALSVAYEPGAQHSPLLVFLNGLVMPAAAWRGAVAHFVDQLQASDDDARPGVLTWDRYGQGQSGKQDHMHDARDVVATLDELLSTLQVPFDRPLILTANSIGVPLARMFVDTYPQRRVRAMLFLDSMMANTDFVSLFDEPPDQVISDEERKGLAVGRQRMQAVFHPSVSNDEGFDRSRLPSQLPYSDSPAIPSQPWVTVLGHDHDFFARDSELRLGIPANVVHKYMNAAWDRYNEGLLKLTGQERGRGIVRPSNASHFIQCSRPDAVAQEMLVLYRDVRAEHCHKRRQESDGDWPPG